jgi:hypothetical protein
MASGSPAELIPFTRFLERRQQLRRITVVNGTVTMLESADLGTRPDVAGTANAGGPPSRESATVHVTMSPGGIGIV